MDWQDVWLVLKWVLVALAAGFVGQFGKSLALFLLKRRRERKQSEERHLPVGASPSSPLAAEERQTLQDQVKVEKKRAKAQVKRLKKS
jgi:hypothetical protein